MDCQANGFLTHAETGHLIWVTLGYPVRFGRMPYTVPYENENFPRGLPLLHRYSSTAVTWLAYVWWCPFFVSSSTLTRPLLELQAFSHLLHCWCSVRTQLQNRVAPSTSYFSIRTTTILNLYSSGTWHYGSFTLQPPTRETVKLHVRKKLISIL